MTVTESKNIINYDEPLDVLTVGSDGKFVVSLCHIKVVSARYKCIYQSKRWGWILHLFSIELRKRSIEFARFRLNSFQYRPIGQLFQLNSSRPRFRPIEFVIDSFNLVSVHVIGYFDFVQWPFEFELHRKSIGWRGWIGAVFRSHYHR